MTRRGGSLSSRHRKHYSNVHIVRLEFLLVFDPGATDGYVRGRRLRPLTDRALTRRFTQYWSQLSLRRRQDWSRCSQSQRKKGTPGGLLQSEPSRAAAAS
jgi:hypothetical protein